jgi:hypothetical protein
MVNPTSVGEYTKIGIPHPIKKAVERETDSPKKILVQSDFLLRGCAARSSMNSAELYT